MSKFVLVGRDDDGRSKVLRTQEVALNEASAALVDGFPVAGEMPAPAANAKLFDLGDLGLHCSPGTAYWGVANHPPGQEWGMHYTATVDFDIVVSGSTTLLLDDGEVELLPGDCVLIDGVPHDWRAGPDGCELRVLLIGKAFVAAS